jgi:nitrogen regulatory protein PII
MHPVKRIEIIVSSMELPKITQALEKAGVPGYSVIKDVVGKSDLGTVSDDFDLAASTLSNIYILSYCPPDIIKQVVEIIRPVLNKYGGACYISEAMEVRSIKCVAKL